MVDPAQARHHRRADLAEVRRSRSGGSKRFWIERKIALLDVLHDKLTRFVARRACSVAIIFSSCCACFMAQSNTLIYLL